MINLSFKEIVPYIAEVLDMGKNISDITIFFNREDFNNIIPDNKKFLRIKVAFDDSLLKGEFRIRTR